MPKEQLGSQQHPTRPAEVPPAREEPSARQLKRLQRSRTRKDTFHAKKREEVSPAAPQSPPLQPAAIAEASSGGSAGKREAALVGADKSPQKPSEPIGLRGDSRPAAGAQPPPAGRKKSRGELLFSNALDMGRLPQRDVLQL
jgi:hypothetical protein